MEMLVIAVVVVLSFAGVLVPLMRRGRSGEADDHEFAGDTASPVAPVSRDPALTNDEVEREVQRYRTAVRAGTVCRKCGQANPADSLFCFECGAQLPLADAKEFE